MSVRRALWPTLLLLLVLCPTSSRAGEPGSPLFWGFALDGHPITGAMIEKVEAETGIQPQMVVFFLQWPEPGGAGLFPRASLEAIWARGAVPVVTWEPMFYKEGRETMIPHAEILGGKYDGYLDSFAREARAWGRPFMIRFAHEMNLQRYHWGTEKQEYGAGSPEVYRNLFRYVVSRFRKMNAHNALWVFCPNAESVPNPSHDPLASWNQARRYYPGDDFVNVLGMDGYNWGTTQTVDRHGWKSDWRSFEAIFRPLYEELKALSPGKPVFVFETASANEGGDKTAWIEDALKVLGQWNVRGVVWFQARKEVDWRIQSGGSVSYLPAVRSGTGGSQSQGWIRGFTGREGYND
jgi:mannan endo-1,4-beta-mannosidase